MKSLAVHRSLFLCAKCGKLLHSFGAIMFSCLCLCIFLEVLKCFLRMWRKLVSKTFHHSARLWFLEIFPIFSMDTVTPFLLLPLGGMGSLKIVSLYFFPLPGLVLRVSYSFSLKYSSLLYSVFSQFSRVEMCVCRSSCTTKTQK